LGTLCQDKIRYRDRIGAQLALLRIQRKAERKKRKKAPTRVYECQVCKGWHTTSQEQKTPKTS
jgi:hypothetical protein